MEPNEFERRLTAVQTQLERLSRKAELRATPVEDRLASMAEEYGRHLSTWASTVERHAKVVEQLETYASQWRDASRQMREDTADRLQELVTTIESGWETLKGMQEEPIRELREQATSLTQASAAMVHASRQDGDPGSRPAFEHDVQLRLDELTSELKSALAEIRTRLDRQPALQSANAQWSLDDVTRLHGQLREGAIDARELPTTHEVVAVAREPGTTGMPARWTVAAIVGLAIAAVLAGLFGWRVQRQLAVAEERQRVTDLKNRSMLDDAARRSDAAREAAAKELAAARAMANRAQRIADVLAAPDLIRFTLSGADGASGQALVSRTRGFVISGSLLPAPPANGTHQAWLLTRTAAVKMGSLAAEPGGTVTLAEEMPAVPRAIVGVMVTEEPLNGGDTPSVATTVLTSVRTSQVAAAGQP